MDLFPDIFAAKRTVSTGVVTTPNVITPQPSYQYGTVGTYVIAGINVIGRVEPGTTLAGSSLVYYTGSAGALNSVTSSLAYTTTTTSSLGTFGTWRLMTYASGSAGISVLGLLVRIS